jgi:glucose/arabinose dehydrogenase
MRIIRRRAGVLLVLCFLASCGGGGGSGAGGPGGVANTPVAPAPVPQPPPAAGGLLALSEVAQVDNAVYLSAPPGDTRLFIVDRTGRVLVMENGALRATPFLDVSSRTSTAGEGGLLSIAFDPQFASNGRVYIVYVARDNVITLERYTVGSDRNVLDPASQLTVLQIPHPDFTNHYGGQLAFGPDDMLYLSTGDGGGAGDPRGNAQNPLSLLGKLLRLDVRNATATRSYEIPASNPYNGMSSRRNEIWALGLRNPWRFSFDGNLLYIADVGQAQREEVDISDAGAGGLNYGWNILEGGACYSGGSCDTAGLTLPVHEYDHGANNANGCSITGGYVYRGAKIAHLSGSYVFSDYCGGYLKSLRYAGGGAPTVTTWDVAKVGGVLSFGRDGSGELYLIGSSGKIYRIDNRSTSSG